MPSPQNPELGVLRAPGTFLPLLFGFLGLAYVVMLKRAALIVLSLVEPQKDHPGALGDFVVLTFSLLKLHSVFLRRWKPSGW